jgi:hypothetical protein
MEQPPGRPSPRVCHIVPAVCGRLPTADHAAAARAACRRAGGLHLSEKVPTDTDDASTRRPSRLFGPGLARDGDVDGGGPARGDRLFVVCPRLGGRAARHDRFGRPIPIFGRENGYLDKRPGARAGAAVVGIGGGERSGRGRAAESGLRVPPRNAGRPDLGGRPHGEGAGARDHAGFCREPSGRAQWSGGARPVPRLRDPQSRGREDALQRGLIVPARPRCGGTPRSKVRNRQNGPCALVVLALSIRRSGRNAQ